MEIDDGLNHSLERLYSHFHQNVDTMTFYTAEVVRIYSAALDASNIRHAPITSQIKSWESAKRTISRQHEERNQRTRLPDALFPFQTPEDMLGALHDFCGMRISLDFPGRSLKYANY